jgi:uncharacterized membrane protein
MGINWKSPRTLFVLAAVMGAFLAWSIAAGAFRTWDGFDYFGWFVALPVFVLFVATLIAVLVRALGGGKRRD